ncbi:MAG: hypothetical protein Q9223_004888 [Gallowayella weberi]
MSNPISTASRVRGSLYGVAVCDALGAPVEFCQRGSFRPVTGFRENPNFDLQPGCWTDDTSMTLCLAQSLVDTKGQFTPQDQVKKYIKWKQAGYMSSIGECFDIGNATRNALSIWRVELLPKSGPDPEAMEKGQLAIDKALKHKVQCGNGSLMRVSPIGLVYHRDHTKAMEYAAASSRLTHPYLTNSEACSIYTKLIASTFLDLSKSDLASIISDWSFTDPDLKTRFEKYGKRQRWKEVGQEQISSSGYVVHSLDASLWAFFTTNTFEEGALRVVNLGDDADTVGAIYGGIAGAFYGLEAIPPKWLKGLKAKSIVDDVVESLVILAEGS